MSRLSHKNIFSYLSLIILIFIFLGCEKKNKSVIDSSGIAPFIGNTYSSLSNSQNISIINTDTINIGNIRKPDDLIIIQSVATIKAIHIEGQNKIRSVSFSVLNSESSVITEGALFDNGVSPDIKKNDSIYSANIVFQFKRVIVGTFYVNFWSESADGYLSNTIILPIQIVRLNHPPTVSNLQAADTLNRGMILRLTIQASDSDGLSDIYSVGFISRKPDGVLANNGNLIPMLDDGNVNFTSGDAIANDGIYTYTYTVPSDAMLGTYIYTFFAQDRSRVSSDSIIHRIVIRQ